MTPALARFRGLLLIVPLVAGCADGQRADEGDCTARIGWEGVVYRSHSELDPAAPRGERLGSGDVLDCDGSSVATVRLFGVDGVDSSLAIRTTGEWPGVYAAEGTPRSSWPDVLEGP